MKLRYEKFTNTIRTVPENYCVCVGGRYTDAAIVKPDLHFKTMAASPDMFALLVICYNYLDDPNKSEMSAGDIMEQIEKLTREVTG